VVLLCAVSQHPCVDAAATPAAAAAAAAPAPPAMYVPTNPI